MPGLGTSGGDKFLLSVGWRAAKSTRSFDGFRNNENISFNWGPHERISIMDVTGRYLLTPRVSLVATLPIVFNSFSMFYPPNGPGQSVRSGADSNGIGDLSLFAQRWMLKPKDHPFGNFAAGIGMKIPTGNYNVQADLPNLTGAGFMQRTFYPPAIMPGDGGTGIIFGVNGWKQLRKGWWRGNTLFANASYLANPRDTNGTNSIVQSFGVPLAPQFLTELTNSVTDSWNVQAGASIKIPKTWDKPILRGLRGRVTFNWEGIPNHDLFGKSQGYRQPGYIMSVAPGFTYTFRKSIFIAEVPIVFSRYINGTKSAIPDLNQDANGTVVAAPFTSQTNLGMVPSVAVSLRYAQSF